MMEARFVIAWTFILALALAFLLPLLGP